MNQAYYGILEGHDVKVIGRDEPGYIEKWANWFEANYLKRVVQLDEFAIGIKPYRVSTVFLGLNHAFDDGARPLWFETMVFDETKPRGCDCYANRYETWDEALTGHLDTVAKLKAGTLETYSYDVEGDD